MDEIIKKHKKLIKEEINQSWQIVFGDITNPKKFDIYKVNDITIRNIWMEDMYLYNSIKKLRPEENFHKSEQYVLKWKPPNSYYQCVIPLSDFVIQESVVLEIAKLRKARQKKLIFSFVPVLPDMKLFAEKTHPAALVEFKTKNAVLKKISDMFLEGKLPISELQHIFSCDYTIWKIALYNLLPPDWQAYHEYLNVPPDKEVTDRDMEKSYLNDEITLKEYEGFKYPERKELNEMRALQYPLPPQYSLCVICGEHDIGIVRCLNCENMACVACVRRVFLDNKTGDGSFMLMHHKYCLRLGSLKPIKLELKQEPAFLR